MEITKPDRLAAIEAQPAEIRDYCIIEWADVASILGYDDVEHCRKVVIRAGLPTVRLSERKNCPRLGALREFIKGREVIS